MATRSQIRSPRKAASAAVVCEEAASLSLSARALLALAAAGAALYGLRLWLSPLSSWDLWFHMKTGEWILANHRLPAGDLFSAGSPGREWIVNAWLGEILLWLPYRLAGAAGLMIFQIALSLAVFALIFLAVRRMSEKPILSLLTVTLALLASYFRYIPRPDLYTLVLLAVMLRILYRYKLRQSEGIFRLIPLGLLWPNLHMGFTTAFAVLGCFLIGEGAMAALRKPAPDEIVSGPRFKRLALASAGMALATLVNPYGPKAWFFIAKLRGLFGFSSEWTPLIGSLTPGMIAQTLALALLAAITVIALARSRRARDLTGFLLAAVFAGMALKYNRQAAQFCLVAPFVIAVAARGLCAPVGRFSRAQLAGIGSAAVLGVVIAAWAMLVFCGKPASHPIGFGIEKSQFSEGAVKFIRDSGLAGKRVFNSLEPGGWLIWNLAPEQKVFIDGRIDMYGPEAVTRYLGISTDPQIGGRLREQGIDYCYFRYPLGPESTATNYPAFAIAADPNWSLVYFDDGALIYALRDARNADLLERYAYRFLNPLGPPNSETHNPDADLPIVLAEVARTKEECPDSARAHMAAGTALQMVGNNEEAYARLQQARRLAAGWRPAEIEALEDYLGRAAMDLNRNGQAEAHYRAALKLAIEVKDGPEREAELHSCLGYVLFKRAKYSQAELESREALKLNEQAPLALITLGCVKKAQKQFGEATGFFEEAMRVSPDLSLRLLLAESYALAGNTDSALTELEAAAKENPRAVAAVVRKHEYDKLRVLPRFRADRERFGF